MIFSYLLNMQSHPSWVCGLKPPSACNTKHALEVTPFVGVWIETILRLIYINRNVVTPFVGVWIETNHHDRRESKSSVTPFVGVWIETQN